MSRNIGRYRHRVEIQAKTESTNAIGEKVAVWSTVDNRWARIRPLSGREYVGSQQVQATATHEISFLAVDGLTVRHRIKHGTRLFDINHINNIEERDIEQQCVCTEAV